jgi:predicted nucleotidyltransferase
VDEPTIHVTPASNAEVELWRLTRQVSEILRGLPWVLIGGQMVAIIEIEHGGAVGRATADVDVVVDVRAFSTVTRQAADRLVAAGFEPKVGAEGLVYRFIRGDDIVDLLAPDNLGTRRDLTTVPPDMTLETIGGTQALRRSRTVRVDAGEGPFSLPLPSLVGALVIKARAAANARTTREKHERDLARLLALVVEPRTVRAELSAKERGYLRAHFALTNVAHRAWRNIASAEDGTLALSIIIE